MQNTKKQPFLLVAFFFVAVHLNAQPVFPVEASSEEPGFESIFDGKTLDGWDGDSTYWRVENGCIVGEVTPENLLERNSFLIWREGTVNDFELKLEYRVSEEGNSGINYRSFEVSGLRWALKGYQCDIDGQGQWSGQNYEERGRTFLALRGQVTRISENRKPEIIGSPGDKEDLQQEINDDWNECHIIAQGNMMTHMINGNVMSIVVDQDKMKRTKDGLLGVQVHVGPPMKIEYRNIRMKKL
jgi:hypothetical protein